MGKYCQKMVPYMCIRSNIFILSRVEIAHIHDSNLIGQLIRSCLRQGCGYADFVNKSKYIITKKCIHDILTHISVKYGSHTVE